MMAGFAPFSTPEALTSLSTAIPDWNRRLDELNSQIAQRQQELARLTENEHLPPRSVKNKGSTESLRPQDDDQIILTNPFNTPQKPHDNGINTNPFAVPRPDLVVTPPHSKQRPSPAEISRKPSVNTPPMQTRFGLRKRKTDSVASAESQAPKYRSRSMIIVYYDSTVQTAFEDLVKFVSASRNSMRKGKMNAKMEAMRLVAERETEEEIEVDIMQDLTPSAIPSGLPKLEAQPDASSGSGSATPLEAANDDDDIFVPQLKFVSTRNMGPPRMGGPQVRGRPLVPDLKGGMRSAMGPLEVNDIFDELDKGLEWCQSQCERAAHQFLRDGDCSDEIEGIKKRLLSVKEKAEAEVERLKKVEAERPSPRPTREVAVGKSRELRRPQMRKAIGAMRGMEPDKPSSSSPSSSSAIAVGDVVKKNNQQLEMDNGKLEVGKMEVDEDEGYEDLEMPSLMNFRRTRDMGR